MNTAYIFFNTAWHGLLTRVIQYLVCLLGASLRISIAVIKHWTKNLKGKGFISSYTSWEQYMTEEAKAGTWRLDVKEGTEEHCLLAWASWFSHFVFLYPPAQGWHHNELGPPTSTNQEKDLPATGQSYGSIFSIKVFFLPRYPSLVCSWSEAGLHSTGYF